MEGRSFKRKDTETQKREHAGKRKKPSYSFTREIRCLMHAFGDCEKPLWDSVLYVEKILRQQMNLLLTKSSEVAQLRSGESISHEDLLFLLRKNKVKIRRLLVHLHMKDIRDMMHNTWKHAGLVQNPASGKRLKKLLNMIENLFMYKNILKEDIPDPIMQSRIERKYNIVRSMSAEEYLEFKNREQEQQASFFSKEGDEDFSSWLLEDGVTDMTPSSFALEIIHYLSGETICEIIDLVMMLRKEKILNTPSIPSPVQQPTVESIEMKEGNKSKVEEESNESEDAITVSEIQEAFCRYMKISARNELLYNDSKDAITVSEIQEAFCRYMKISARNELFYNESLDVLIPDSLLLCC